MLRYFDGAGGQYRIAFSPLQLATILKGAGPYKFNGSLAAPPNLPAPQTVEMGQPLETTLYQDASSRVYDQILFQWSAFPDWPAKQAVAFRQGAMRLVSRQLFT